jgi:hypothetical protein
MKKLIVTCVASTAVAAGAMAQGSIAGIDATSQYVTTQGANATDPNGASTWYTGSLTLEVLFSSAATAAQDISSINAYNGTANGGYLAYQAALSDGFTEVSLTGDATTSVGTVSGQASSGNNLRNFPDQVVLSTAFAPNTVGTFTFVFSTTIGGVTYYGTEAFSGSYGGQQVTSPLGTQASVTDAINAIPENLVLTPVVPEPTTMALAALGGASLLLFRRKK